MMCRLALEERKDGARRCRGRAVILIADSRVYISAQSLRLGVFIGCEQAAKQIGSAGEDGAQPFAREIGLNIFGLALGRSLDEKPPNRRRIFPRRRFDLRPLDMT